MLLLQHSSTPVGIDRLLAFRLLAKISATAVADSSSMHCMLDSPEGLLSFVKKEGSYSFSLSEGSLFSKERRLFL